MFPTSVLLSSLGGWFHQEEEEEEEVGGDHGGRHPAAECRPGRKHAACLTPISGADRAA